jgi:hypothetical protein
MSPARTITVTDPPVPSTLASAQDLNRALQDLMGSGAGDSLQNAMTSTISNCGESNLQLHFQMQTVGSDDTLAQMIAMLGKYMVHRVDHHALGPR